MKLLSIRIDSAASCGGILNGLEVYLRDAFGHRAPRFDPICLIGPNGSGKSQFLQALAEIFQAAWHACAPREERQDASPGQGFEVEYLVWDGVDAAPCHVRLSRSAAAPDVVFETRSDGEWVRRAPADPATRRLLPARVIAYTSGENETLSMPFFVSRSGYAEEVRTKALPSGRAPRRPARGAPAGADPAADPLEPRLMLIDYGTHLEVLVANLLLGSEAQRRALLEVARLESLRSVRCVIQLAHGRQRRATRGTSDRPGRKGVQLTAELEGYIEQLKACATCWDYEPDREVYTFDYWCDEATGAAFRSFFGSAFELYRALHKLALLNDLAISRDARQRFTRDVVAQRFAARLPEPPDEDKVFRFEQVTFRADAATRTVDYVSLSDGEHQMVEILGVFAMIKERNVLFLLDEPESHFNPQWRVAFMKLLRDVPTEDGRRGGAGASAPDDGSGPAPVGALIEAAAQDVLLTTHAPFVPSDMPRENVLIFERSGGRIGPRAPDVETFGASYEQILEHCFRVEPPISELARAEIRALMASNDPVRVAAAVPRLGDSVEKVILLDHLRALRGGARDGARDEDA